MSKSLEKQVPDCDEFVRKWTNEDEYQDRMRAVDEVLDSFHVDLPERPKKAHLVISGILDCSTVIPCCKGEGPAKSEGPGGLLTVKIRGWYKDHYPVQQWPWLLSPA